MKTRMLELIKIVDDLNDRNKAIRNKQKLEVYSYTIWDEVGVSEVVA